MVNLSISPGLVEAQVQGTRPISYQVTLNIPPLSAAQWEQQATAAMGEQALFTATLLAGEMPQEIEQAFAAAGAVLLPQSKRDIQASCWI